MNDKKQSIEDIDELHNSILSLCEDKCDDTDASSDETDGNFIKSLIEYNQDDTIQNTIVSTDQDKSNTKFVTIDSIHNTRESPNGGDKGQRSLLEVYDVDKDKSDIKFITVDSVHDTKESLDRENKDQRSVLEIYDIYKDKSDINFITVDSVHDTKESLNRESRGQRSMLEICNTSCLSPVVASSNSFTQSPVILSGKRKVPDESGDNLEVSSILNTPNQFKGFGKNKSPRKVIYQSTPLDPGGKGMFKTSSITAQSTPLNTNSQKDCPYSSQTRLNLFKEKIYDELGVLDEEDDPTVTFEDLLSELTMLLDDDNKDKEKPTKMKSEELKLLSGIKTENQISRIDLDSLMLEDGRQKCDDVNTSTCSNASDTSIGKPGRFSRLNATVRNTVIDEVDEDMDETEDILGLDDYAYSDAELDELSSDEEKTLLFDESALCKTVIKNKSKSEIDKQKLTKISDSRVNTNQSPQIDSSKSSALGITAVVDSGNDKFIKVETSIKDGKESNIDEPNKTEDDENYNVTLHEDTRGLDSKGDFVEKTMSQEVKVEKDIETTEKEVSIKIIGIKEAKNFDKNISEKKDQESMKIFSEDKKNKSANISKVSPVKVSNSDQTSKTILQSDIEKPITENKTVILNDSIEPASEKMKEVMMRWNSKDIPKPDTNLTYAHWARENLGIPYGRLEGHHLSTLDTTANKIETSGEQPPAKRQKMSITPICNAKANLESQIRELSVIERNNADEIYRERKTVLMNLEREEYQRTRMLYMQQQLEIRQLHVQYNTYMINAPFFNVQLLQLRQEHELQKFQLKDVYREKVEERHRFYFQKVNQRNQQYTHRKEQLNCLLNQLQNQPELNQNNNNCYGPRVTVDLVKGPCVTNNQTSSIVTVCLPADIAAAIIREDEIYDMFYEHPKLTKQDLKFKKKPIN